MSTLGKYLEKLPKALGPMRDIADDQTIMIYQGRFNLINKYRKIPAEGNVYYSFKRADRIIIEGTIDEKTDILEWSGNTVRISTNGISGKLMMTRVSISYNAPTLFRGVVLKLRVGKSASYQQWRWSYANMPYFHGEPINNNGSIERGRMEFVYGSFRIIMENRSDLSRYAQLKEGVKYISHYCAIERLDGGQIEESLAIERIVSFSYFMSFVVGCRHSPLFIQGLDGNSTITEIHMLSIDDSDSNVVSWEPYPYDLDIIDLWKAFNQKRTTRDKSDVMNTAIHWYIEANANHGMLDGAFIMAFAGLELMYNVLIGESNVRNEGMVGEIAALLNIREKVSPSSIANMRNQLVHYGEDNRTKYSMLSNKEKEKRMEMILELLELSILYWLEYKGHYHDRISGPCYRGDNVFMVPWVNPETA